MPRKKNIEFIELQTYFHLPIQVVAKKLDVCATLLKKICRRNGITRWPHRKVKCLDKWLNTLEETCQVTDEVRMRDQIEDLKVQKNRLMKNPNCEVKISSNIKKRALALRSAVEAMDGTPAKDTGAGFQFAPLPSDVPELPPVNSWMPVDPSWMPAARPPLELAQLAPFMRPMSRVPSGLVPLTPPADLRPLQRVRSDDISLLATRPFAGNQEMRPVQRVRSGDISQLSSSLEAFSQRSAIWQSQQPPQQHSLSPNFVQPEMRPLQRIPSDDIQQLAARSLHHPEMRPLQRVRSDDIAQLASMEDSRQSSVKWQPQIRPASPSSLSGHADMRPVQRVRSDDITQLARNMEELQRQRAATWSGQHSQAAPLQTPQLPRAPMKSALELLMEVATTERAASP
eukprot:TRINITY_DN8326_c0_g1_i1.p2 TRINITY_DN8326_c0_g1~~TRINITY_DN8326_c0_g1_i1.p2  ORF type:complete len:399 (-),score=79.95 TRINITY_DN8326_c0_g1_i1:1699-2895(-)